MIETAPQDPGYEPARAEQVRHILRQVILRRSAGEELHDAAILADHPHLASELGAELHKLALIAGAHRRSRSASGSLPDALTGTEESVLPAWFSAPPGYEVIHEIHRGGQGIVFRALQLSTAREVAIKALREGSASTPEARLRFEREVQLLSSLRHPNIVAIHDSGVLQGRVYYVMPYVSGPTFDEYARRIREQAGRGAGRRAALESLVRTMIVLCDAVNAAHLVGVIHRDLKPGNIRFDEDGEPRVLDFGLAKFSDDDEHMTQTGQFLGSLPWASPEQARGQAALDVRSDVYALGLLLYHGLTGQFPYPVTGDTPAVLNHIVATEPRAPALLNAAISGDLQAIILKCLAKERQRRYQNAGELARELRRYLAGEPVEARRDSVAYFVGKFAWRHRLAVGAAAAFVLLLTGTSVALGLLYTQQTHLLGRSRDAEAAAQEQLYLASISAAARALESLEFEAAFRHLQRTPPQYRNWEWRYLNASIDTSLHVIDLGDIPGSSAMSPDGRTLYIPLMRTGLAVLDTESLQVRKVLEAGEAGFKVATNADGTLVATSVDNPVVVNVWNAADFSLLSRIEGSRSRNQIAFHPTEPDLLALLHIDGLMQVWQVDPPALRNEFSVASAPDWRNCFQFLDCGDVAVAGPDDRTPRVVTLAGGEAAPVLEGQTDFPMHSLIATEGYLIAAGERDHTAPEVNAWDLRTGEHLARVTDHAYGVCPPLVQDGRLFTASWDTSIGVWDLRSGAPIARLTGHTDGLARLHYSAAQDLLFSTACDKTIRVWDPRDLEPAVYQPEMHGISWSIAWLPGSEPILAAVIAIGFDHKPLPTARLAFWNAATRQQLDWSVDLPGEGNPTIDALPNPARVLITRTDGSVRTFDPLRRNFATVRAAEHPHAAGVALFHVGTDASGAVLAVSAGGSTCEVYDLASNTLRFAFDLGAACWNVGLTPDGTRLLACTRDGHLSCWVLGQDSAEPLWRIRLGSESFRLATSPDGQSVALAEREEDISVWSVRDGSLLWREQRHNGRLHGLCYSPDGTRLASISNDWTMRLWDAHLGELLVTFRDEHRDYSTCVKFSPDGEWLATSSSDGTVRMRHAARE